MILFYAWIALVGLWFISALITTYLLVNNDEKAGVAALTTNLISAATCVLGLIIILDSFL